VLHIMSVMLVVGTLLAVVVAQAILANGQVKLSGLQHQLSLEQSLHRQGELAVAQLETPSRIVGSASNQLHMVRPDQVTELPYVSLSAPLPTPKVAPRPATPAAAATSTAATAAAAAATSTAAAQPSHTSSAGATTKTPSGPTSTTTATSKP
jgi:cytoskeletal protein RodZ